MEGTELTLSAAGKALAQLMMDENDAYAGVDVNSDYFPAFRK